MCGARGDAEIVDNVLDPHASFVCRRKKSQDFDEPLDALRSGSCRSTTHLALHDSAACGFFNQIVECRYGAADRMNRPDARPSFIRDATESCTGEADGVLAEYDTTKYRSKLRAVC